MVDRRARIVFLFCWHYPRGDTNPGGKNKKHTLSIHTPHIHTSRWTNYEQQYKRQRGKEKEEEVEVGEEEEENTWGCLARPKRPKGPAEPAKKQMVLRKRVPFVLRRFAGGSGKHNIYDLRDKLEAVLLFSAIFLSAFFGTRDDAVLLADRSPRNISDSSNNFPLYVWHFPVLHVTLIAQWRVDDYARRSVTPVLPTTSRELHPP